jgi:hypothetical protein
MTKEALLQALKPHFRTISSLIRAATDEFESYNIPLERRPVVDRGPSGIMIWHLIWDYFERHFGYTGPVRVAVHEGLRVLFFEESGVSVRTNKLDSVDLTGPIAKEPSKIHAHPQMCFAFHDEQPGNLIFGYTKKLNEDGSCVLDRVYLTLENQDGVQWWTFIDDDEDSCGITPIAPTHGPGPVLVRPKKLPQKPAQAGGDSTAV